MLTLCRLLIIVFLSILFLTSFNLHSISPYCPFNPYCCVPHPCLPTPSAKPLVQKRREQLARDAQRGDLADTDPLVKQQQQFHAAQPRFVGGGFALSATQ
jgi:hypothetical protein